MRKVNKPKSTDKVMIHLSLKIHPVNASWRMSSVSQMVINTPPHSYLKPKIGGCERFGTLDKSANVLVCLTRCSKDLMVRVDQLCASRNIKVFCGDVYGYHGYMFSDLGQEHHYVEEKPKVVKGSNKANDGPEAKKLKVDPNETTMVKKTVSFCSLKAALEVDWTNEKAKNNLKRIPVDYFLLQVLLKFRTDKGRDPQPDSFAEDSQLLLQIRNDVLETMGLSSELLPNTFVSYCFSEMAPVCAVVGGVLGQEIVKALSQRDAPHRNFFFFDGLKGSGVVDYFGSK
ncbi:SUMO-activating enzyme subunit 1-like isoform X3 [Sinocyclocheilus anshuiensis]|uniref:SUMO-activating enzyme subunit 1-like isoform X3 n=1 Tax=Sinocyclocheilus anshuiensis TaxID=1608454 RepID=UPI0007BA548C|nr:PREDICTED: SUMO-activating enzyme subunit 1-like isoform X3 [Sinocyclocheilus anshuiensis]